jgi:3-hydroxyisobutyrate dehydrogenase
MTDQTPPAPVPVGFVGAGAMGEPMIRNLAKRGIAVHVFDADGRRMKALAGEPGVLTQTSLQGLKPCPYAICMLPSSEIVEDVVTGPRGLLDVLSPGSMIIDMGSSRPHSTISLAEKARQAGLRLVDAPVSGGVSRARSATLTIMFGGTADQLSVCSHVLLSLGDNLVHVGGVGSGHAMKALNNLSSAVSLVAAVEILKVGRSLGLEPNTMLDVLNGSTGRTYATEHKMRQYVLNGAYASGFSFRLMLKDLDTAMDMAQHAGVTATLGERCWQLWREAIPSLPENADHTEIARVIQGPNLIKEDN